MEGVVVVLLEETVVVNLVVLFSFSFSFGVLLFVLFSLLLLLLLLELIFFSRDCAMMSPTQYITPIDRWIDE